MPYRAPVDEYSYIFDHVVDFDQVTKTTRFEEANGDMVAAILTEAGRMTEEVLYPIQRNGDMIRLFWKTVWFARPKGLVRPIRP